MDELTSWLRAQIAVDDREARGWPEDLPPPPDGTCWRDVHGHPVTQPRGRAMRQVKAYRAILDMHADSDFPYDPEDGPGQYSWTARCDRCYKTWPCPTLRALASIYSDREGYREEWA